MNNWAQVVFCSLAFLACENDGSSLNVTPDGMLPDVGPQQADDANLSDAASAQPDAARVPDAGSNRRGDVSTPLDSTAPGRDSAIEDTDTAVIPQQDGGLADSGAEIVVDASVPQMPRRSAGQCGNDDDCPNGVNGQNCSRALPGGTCLGCGTDADCPTEADCNFGTCVVACGSDEDCAPGLSCLSRGRCGATPCVNGRCPDSRFACSAGDRCTRRTCDRTDDCASGTACVSGLCIESDWL